VIAKAISVSGCIKAGVEMSPPRHVLVLWPDGETSLWADSRNPPLKVEQADANFERHGEQGLRKAASYPNRVSGLTAFPA